MVGRSLAVARAEAAQAAARADDSTDADWDAAPLVLGMRHPEPQPNTGAKAFTGFLPTLALYEREVREARAATPLDGTVLRRSLEPVTVRTHEARERDRVIAAAATRPYEAAAEIASATQAFGFVTTYAHEHCAGAAGGDVERQRWGAHAVGYAGHTPRVPPRVARWHW